VKHAAIAITRVLKTRKSEFITAPRELKQLNMPKRESDCINDVEEYFLFRAFKMRGTSASLMLKKLLVLIKELKINLYKQFL
jgi:hypothetical protein